MKIMETVEFRLVEGVSEAEFLRANEQVMHWVTKQRGFESRALARDSLSWLDCTVWQDQECATHAQQCFMAEMCSSSFIKSIDEASVVMHHRAIIA